MRGIVIAVVGPDGTGKSTLVDGIARSYPDSVRYHFRVGVLPRPGSILGREARSTETPHEAPPHHRALSALLTMYYCLDALIGHIARAAPALRHGRLVLFERHVIEIAVDPRRYRLSGGMQRLLRVVPKPDLILVLAADASEIHRRKPELSVAEIRRQLDIWRQAEKGDPRRFKTVKATDVAETLEESLCEIRSRLTSPISRLERFSAALACLGRPDPDGVPYSVVSVNRSARWVLPRRRGAPGPLGARLYRPASPRHAVGALALEGAQRAGGIHLPGLLIDPRVGLAPELAAALHRGSVELAALLPMDPARSNRTVLSVLERGRPVAIAKVALAPSEELARELRVLAALERTPLERVVAARPLASFRWRDLDVVVMTVLPFRGSTARSPGRAEEDALVELARVSDSAASALGGTSGVLVHGDFCGWNSAVIERDRLALWDWEWAHMGEPLEDWFHWQTQRLVHFGRGTAEALVRAALSPDRRLRRLCVRLGVDPEEAPIGLTASLRHGLSRLSPGTSGRARELREQALSLLGEAP